MRILPMFASPAVYTRWIALTAQLRKLHFGNGQIFSRDMTVQCDAQHPCWKAAHLLPCTRPPEVMRMHRPKRATYVEGTSSFCFFWCFLVHTLYTLVNIFSSMSLWFKYSLSSHTFVVRIRDHVVLFLFILGSVQGVSWGSFLSL